MQAAQRGLDAALGAAVAHLAQEAGQTAAVGHGHQAGQRHHLAVGRQAQAAAPGAVEVNQLAVAVQAEDDFRQVVHQIAVAGFRGGQIGGALLHLLLQQVDVLLQIERHEQAAMLVVLGAADIGRDQAPRAFGVAAPHALVLDADHRRVEGHRREARGIARHRPAHRIGRWPEQPHVLFRLVRVLPHPGHVVMAGFRIDEQGVGLDAHHAFEHVQLRPGQDEFRHGIVTHQGVQMPCVALAAAIAEAGQDHLGDVDAQGVDQLLAQGPHGVGLDQHRTASTK